MKRCMVGIGLIVIAYCWSAKAQDATMFRGDLLHTGVYNARGVPQFSAIQWKFHTNGRVIASPAALNGVVYVGSTDGNFYAIDAKSGTLKWKFETKAWEVSSPTIVGGAVYFLSYDGHLYGLDAASGQVKWKFATGGEKHYAGTHLHFLQPAAESMPDPWDFYLSSPAIWNGTVYFGSSDGYVYALSADSGDLKWKFKTGDVVHSSPAIANGTVFIGSWDTYLYALGAASGNEKWRFKTGDDPDAHNHIGIQSSPAVMDGVVYFGSRDSYAYAVDAETGKQLWKFSTDGSWVNNSMVVHDGKAYFGTSIPGFMHALTPRRARACSICRLGPRSSLQWPWPETRYILEILVES